MNKMTKKIIPDLRFPEFVKDEGWEMKSVGYLCDILNNLRKPITGSNRKKGDYPYYGASGIIDYVDEYIFDERLLLVGEDGAKWNAFEKTAFLVEGKYWVNNHAHVLKPIKINDKLLESYLVKLDLQPYITGAAPPKLTLGKLKEIPIPFIENPKEQQKIASCLSSLDELITAQKEKLELLKNHKKGLMQNLFPQEGETVPKFRFPEFENDGEWIENSLESLTTRIGDGIHTTPKYSIDGEYAFINGNNLINGKIVIEESTKRVSKEEYLKHNRNLSDATILLSINGTIGNIAKYIDEKVILGKSACYINIESNKVYKNFIFYYIQTGTIKSYFNSELTGSTIKNLSLKSIKETKLKIPTDLLEQQKIASCLSSLDELISSQTDKIEKLQLHKKGLMQGLFPKIID